MVPDHDWADTDPFGLERPEREDDRDLPPRRPLTTKTVQEVAAELKAAHATIQAKERDREAAARAQHAQRLWDQR
jgi:hypothetical protein